MMGGFPYPSQFTNTRKGNYTTLADPKIIQAIEKAEYWDMLLYDYALTLFRNELKTVGMKLPTAPR